MTPSERLKEIEDYFVKYNCINETEHAWILNRVKKLEKDLDKIKWIEDVQDRIIFCVKALENE